MKVRELLQLLSKLESELEVLCCSEDAALVPKGQLLRLLHIEAVNTTQAERLRLDDGTPYLKLGKSPASAPLAILEVTSEF